MAAPYLLTVVPGLVLADVAVCSQTGKDVSSWNAFLYFAEKLAFAFAVAFTIQSWFSKSLTVHSLRQPGSICCYFGEQSYDRTVRYLGRFTPGLIALLATDLTPSRFFRGGDFFKAGKAKRRWPIGEIGFCYQWRGFLLLANVRH